MPATLADVVRSRIAAVDLTAQPLPSAGEITPAAITSGPVRLRPEVVEAIEAAARAFRESAVGQELAADALQQSPQQVLARVPEVTALPEIQHLAALARGDVFAAQDVGDGTIIKELMAEYAPQSVLIQFVGMGEIVVGVSGYIGFALDLIDLNNAVLYAGGAVSVGADAIFATGQGVGLTANPNSGMTGFGAGVDAGGVYVVGGLLDFSLGLSAPYVPLQNHLIPSQWTAVGYALEGIGASVDAYVSFTLQLINENLPDMIQPPAANSTTVYSITCDKTQDSGKDELYFTVQVDTEPAKVFRYPLWDYFSIGEGKTWDVGFTINFDSSFTLTLYNSNTGSDEEICQWQVSSSGIPQAGGYKTKDYDTGSGGLFHNNIHYEVLLYTPPAA